MGRVVLCVQTLILVASALIGVSCRCELGTERDRDELFPPTLLNLVAWETLVECERGQGYKL